MHPSLAHEPGHYHLSVHTISKLKGDSVLAMAAYRHAELFRADTNSVTHAAAYQRAQELGNDGRVFDYRRKIGVAWTGIMAPAFTPKELLDAQTLWNTVERIEHRKNARLAREMIIALPHQVDLDVHVAMLRAFITNHLVSRGMIADVAIHKPPVEHGGDPRNWHAHVLITDRPMTPDGFAATKDRMWNAKENLLLWRKAWADTHNATMAHLGLPHRIDHRSLEAQRKDALARGDAVAILDLDREPQIHVGKAVHVTHPDRTIYADRRARNEAILTRNKERAAVRADRMQSLIANAQNAAHVEARTNTARVDSWLNPEPLPVEELQRRYGRTGTVAPAIASAITHQARTAVDMFGWSVNKSTTQTSEITSFLHSEAALRGPGRSVFSVTARDIAFVFYSWGLITQTQLQDTLENAWNLEIDLFPIRTLRRTPVVPRRDRLGMPTASPPMLSYTHANTLKDLRRQAYIPEQVHLKRIEQLNAFIARHQARAMRRGRRQMPALSHNGQRRVRRLAWLNGDGVT